MSINVKEILDTLMPIKESTGLDVDIYSGGGNLIFTTGEEKPSYKYCPQSRSKFNNGVIMDKDADITYFSLSVLEDGATGVIMGSNEVSRNYAVMVAKLIEKAVAAGKSVIDKDAKFRLLFSGEINQIQYESLKSGFLGQPFNYYVLSVITKQQNKRADLLTFLHTMAESSDIIVDVDEKTVAYLKKCDGYEEYSSANDFAYILYENIKEEMKIDIKINVGSSVNSFDDLAKAYQQSLFAFNFGTLLDPSSNVYSYKQYLLVKMISDIPKESLSQYIDLLLDKSGSEILKDSELTETADVFMNNSLNISETSRNMYMHRNTLIYRLDKIEAATGLNIRHFNDALTFRIITMLNKLAGK